MTRSPLHRLYDIAQNAENAIALLQGKSEHDIARDWQLASALQMAIVIIAEASNKLPHNLLATQPEVPWSDIIGMGNRLKHNYHHTSGQVIWDTVTNDLPQLLAIVNRMIADLKVETLPS